MKVFALSMIFLTLIPINFCFSNEIIEEQINEINIQMSKIREDIQQVKLNQKKTPNKSLEIKVYELTALISPIFFPSGHPVPIQETKNNENNLNREEKTKESTLESIEKEEFRKKGYSNDKDSGQISNTNPNNTHTLPNIPTKKIKINREYVLIDANIFPFEYIISQNKNFNPFENIKKNQIIYFKFNPYYQEVQFCDHNDICGFSYRLDNGVFYLNEENKSFFSYNFVYEPIVYDEISYNSPTLYVKLYSNDFAIKKRIKFNYPNNSCIKNLIDINCFVHKPIKLILI